MSVANILREAGKPTETSKLVKMLAEKLNITTTHAYRLVKKAWENKEIRKVTLPDRSVLCGLPEWPFPTYGSNKLKQTASFQDAFLYRCFKKLDEIIYLNVRQRESFTAYDELRFLIMTLPSPIKDKLRPEIQKANKALWNCKDKIVHHMIVERKVERQKTIASYYVEKLVDEVSSFLHEQLEKETS